MHGGTSQVARRPTVYGTLPDASASAVSDHARLHTTSATPNRAVAGARSA